VTFNGFELRLQESDKSYSKLHRNFSTILISNDQTGFISDRFIGENLCLIDSFVKYTTAKSMPGLLLLLDFKKAFDTLQSRLLFVIHALMQQMQILKQLAICFPPFDAELNFVAAS